MADSPHYPTGQIGSFTGTPVIQTDAVGQGPGRNFVFAGDRMFLPATRPTLRFPLTEAIAAEAGLDLWYFDPAKWPDREPVDVADYLGIRSAGSDPYPPVET